MLDRVQGVLGVFVSHHMTCALGHMVADVRSYKLTVHSFIICECGVVTFCGVREVKCL